MTRVKQHYSLEELAYAPMHFAIEQLTARELALVWGINKTTAAQYKTGRRPLEDGYEDTLRAYLRSQVE